MPTRIQSTGENVGSKWTLRTPSYLQVVKQSFSPAAAAATQAPRSEGGLVAHICAAAAALARHICRQVGAWALLGNPSSTATSTSADGKATEIRFRLAFITGFLLLRGNISPAFGDRFERAWLEYSLPFQPRQSQSEQLAPLAADTGRGSAKTGVVAHLHDDKENEDRIGKWNGFSTNPFQFAFVLCFH